MPRVIFAPLMGLAHVFETYRTVEISVREPEGTFKTLVDMGVDLKMGDKTHIEKIVHDKEPYREIRYQLLVLHQQRSAIAFIFQILDQNESIEIKKKAQEGLRSLEKCDKVTAYILQVFMRKPLLETADVSAETIAFIPAIFRIAVKTAAMKRQQLAEKNAEVVIQ